jgi:hypothetical protein
MKIARPFCLWICRTLIGMVLFSQFAVAAYTCPSFLALTQKQSHHSTEFPQPVETKNTQLIAAPANKMNIADAMMNCDQMFGQLDKNSPSLCAEHQQYGHQTNETYVPTIHLVSIANFYIVPLLVNDAGDNPSPSFISSYLQVPLQPPSTILHCCFRI